MNTNLYAPVAISTYKRLSHLESTIQHLKLNKLASDSDLFIFSDGPKEGDENAVNLLRDYLKTINGFRSIEIFDRPTNNRIFNNRDGMKTLLNQYGKIIFLEEDVLTAPGFLTFMNMALNKYEDNQRVFSITGYSPPLDLPSKFNEDAFFLRRFNAWGFGIWKDRFEQISYINQDQYEKLVSDKKRVKEFALYGEDMISMLKADVSGSIDALDVKAMYAQFIHDQYTLYPKNSLTKNIGFDGTGLHCGKTDRFNVDLDHRVIFNLPNKIELNDKIIKAHLKFRKPSFGSRLRQIGKKLFH